MWRRHRIAATAWLPRAVAVVIARLVRAIQYAAANAQEYGRALRERWYYWITRLRG
jgi:hypothetical protein